MPRSASPASARPFGVDLLFRSSGAVALTFHVEICEDLWTPIPPSSTAALAGAELLVNLSASNITIGKAETRRLLCAAQSQAAVAAYLYTAAGPGESTTDLAWDGQAGVFELGLALGETERFEGDQAVYADVDLGRIRQERMRLNSFGDSRGRGGRARGAVPRGASSRSTPRPRRPPLRRAVERFPFVPADPARLARGLLRGLQHPGRGAGQAAEGDGLDPRRHRRLRRPRLRPRR